MVAEGALLAQLYPSLEREGKAKLTAYLSSKDVARIKVGDSVRYTTTHDAGNQLFLDSLLFGSIFEQRVMFVFLELNNF
ncbi:competence factor transport protein ComB [Streptococcus pneumoniae]|nr:competence factor transport protein ComB [Streptococcus pneumoniae]